MEHMGESSRQGTPAAVSDVEVPSVEADARDDSHTPHADGIPEEPTDEGNQGKTTRKQRHNPTTYTRLERDPGKSLLPFSRVQKILRADRELPTVAREAIFLISVAAEEFVKRITVATYRTAERDRRNTMQQKDIASLVRRADEFIFLDDIIPFPDPTARATRKPKAAAETLEDASREPTMLDRFVNVSKKSKLGDPEEESASNAIITTNEDGTMSVNPQGHS